MPEDTAKSVAVKLEKLYQSLGGDEKEVLTQMVREALMGAATRFMDEKAYYEDRRVPQFVMGLTGQNAPSLVRSIGLPGSLMAHSIPGCNASALVAISTAEKAKSARA